MTSNVGSEFILETDDRHRTAELALEALKGTFRPEFLNRVDSTLVFNRLDRQAIRGIVDIQLKRTQETLDTVGLSLDVDENAREELARLGYSPAYGARPLKRVIQEKILEPLSSKIVAGKVASGGIVRVQMDGQEICLI